MDEIGYDAKDSDVMHHFSNPIEQGHLQRPVGNRRRQLGRSSSLLLFLMVLISAGSFTGYLDFTIGESFTF